MHVCPWTTRLSKAYDWAMHFARRHELPQSNGARGHSYVGKYQAPPHHHGAILSTFPIGSCEASFLCCGALPRVLCKVPKTCHNLHQVPHQDRCPLSPALALSLRESSHQVPHQIRFSLSPTFALSLRESARPPLAKSHTARVIRCGLFVYPGPACPVQRTSGTTSDSLPLSVLSRALPTCKREVAIRGGDQRGRRHMRMALLGRVI